MHDLPNVLYEVANESSGVSADVTTMPDGMVINTPSADSTPWQHWVIETLKRHEREAGRTPHPVGMTFQFPVADQATANGARHRPGGPLRPARHGPACALPPERPLPLNPKLASQRREAVTVSYHSGRATLGWHDIGDKAMRATSTLVGPRANDRDVI